MLGTGVISEHDFDNGDDPATFISQSLDRLWTPQGLDDLAINYSLTSVDERLFFVVNLEGGHYLDFSPVAALCDTLHEQLGPSLLSHLYHALPLTPTFTPETCHDFIVMSHWSGWDDAEELLWLARQDLAHAQEVDEESLSAEAVEAYADSHYLTPKHVDRLLERRYRKPGQLNLDECRALCPTEGYPQLRSVVDLLRELTRLAETLPESSNALYECLDGYDPFALVIGLEKDAERDLVDELYREYEMDVWNSGEFNPLYALELCVDDAASLETLRRALDVSKQSLELTQTLVTTLERTSCRYP